MPSTYSLKGGNISFQIGIEQEGRGSRLLASYHFCLQPINYLILSVLWEQSHISQLGNIYPRSLFDYYSVAVQVFGLTMVSFALY